MYKYERYNWIYTIFNTININTMGCTNTNIIDEMVYLSEIDKWVPIEEYKEYLQTKYEH